ncbi:AZI1 [Acanthosepion pharaonis]|uniref:AZI1 n=1 Tax=Acanthosepion pharaonis TaxID=158019 RepID=A0A812BE31_ACAPH|nr:AZI1 [Sepia pharaonis]
MSIISSSRRPTVVKQLKNATAISETDRRSKRSTSARSNYSLNTNAPRSNHSNTDATRRKSVAAGSTCSASQLSTERSDMSILSARNKENSRKSRLNHDDFLSIFESNVQPKIKRPESKSKKNPSIIDSLVRSRQSPRSVHATNSSDAFKISEMPSVSKNSPEHNRLKRISLSSDESIPELKMENFLSQSLCKPHSSYASKNRLPDNQPRSSPYLSEDGELLNSQCPSLGKFTQKSHSLNSIANNMTSQAMSPQAKASLSSIENSYRNIKPKTPVNQVRKESNQMELQSLVLADSSPITAAAAPQAKTNSKENSSQQIQINAANKIQRWYRRHYVRKKAGEAAMKRLLNQKRQEKIELQQRELEQEQQEKQEMEQKQMEKKLLKEIKAKEVRLEAVKDMQRKRTEKGNVKKTEMEVAKYSAISPVSTKTSSKITTSVKPSNLYSCNTGARNKQPAANTPMTNGTCTPRIVRHGNAESQKSSPSDKQRTAKLSSGCENVSPKERPSAAGMLESGNTFNHLTELQMTEACDNQLEELFKETSKLVSAANSAIVQVTKSSGHLPFCAEPPSNDHSPDHSIVTGSVIASKNGLPSKAATKSTLSDLLETLKKLEEDEKLGTGKMNVNKNSREIPNTSVNGIGAAPAPPTPGIPTVAAAAAAQDTNGNPQSPYLTAERLEQLNQDQNAEINHVSSEMETTIDASRFPPPPPLPPLHVEDQVKLENASATASEITSHVLSQKLELDEKKHSVAVLQKALSQQRELTVRHAKEADKEMKHRLTLQKNEYEETIKRHLSFIDQLIDDKKVLNEKCEQLVKEVKILDKKYQDRLKMQEESHNIEIKKLKEMNSAAEKLRREKWIEDKTKKIKEMTVKGLEPEIQRLIAKHKSELRKFKQIHEAELLEADERAAQRYVKMTEELRSQLAKEKEAACMHERELAKQRYEKQIQQEEEAFQNERRRLYAEIEAEKKRLASQSLREHNEVDRLQQQLQNAHQQLLQTTKEEFDKSLADHEKRHKIEIQEIREKLALEKAAWEENFMKKQETTLLAKERELKEKVRRDRDKEIELVINRFEEDATNAREECERTAQNRIKRIREKYESEVRELERSERQAVERYNEIKAQLTEAEGVNEQLKVKQKQKTYEIDDLKKMLEKFHQERDHISDVIRQEFVEKIVSTDEENKRLKNEISEGKARHRIDLERTKAEIEMVKKQKEDELEELHKRVKQAIVKKEEIVSQLKVEYQAAVKRADHLEGLLEQQRKQLLGK